MPTISYAQRLSDLAAAAPDRPSVTCGELSLTRSELDAAAVRLGKDLRAHGVGLGDLVTIVLPNGLEWFVAFAACWKIGATPQPASPRLPAPELQALVELADPKAVIGVEPGTFDDRWCVPAGHVPPPDDGEPLPDVQSPSWKAPTSGGSTGKPKLIVSGDPSVLDTDASPPLLLSTDGCLVMPGPLYHNGPLMWSCYAVLWGSRAVLLPRFDAEQTLAAIDRYRADVVYLVPTMMKRIWALPTEVRESYDVSSLRAVWHLAEPCPPWLKDAWIGWLGPDRIWELYAGTEAQAGTVITGREWLAHRGSVGRPVDGTVSVRADDGTVLGPDELGEIWLRSPRPDPTYRYVGAQARRTDDGWESLGDMGWLDADGYLYLGDRSADMILSGGANIYPAEVEAALLEHPAVRSAAVIGLPDDERGNSVHAIVESSPGEVAAGDLLRFVAERLVIYKVPRTVEYVDHPLRDDAGKVRRSALRQARLQSGRSASGVSDATVG